MMEYYSEKHMSIIGKICAAMMILQLIGSFVGRSGLGMIDTIALNIFFDAPLFAFLYRKHEDEIEETGSWELLTEFVQKIMLPTFFLCVASTFYVGEYVNWEFIEYLIPRQFMQWSIYILGTTNLIFIAVYFLNVYMKYFGFHILVRIVAMIAVFFIVTVLFWFYISSTIPGIMNTLPQQQQIPEIATPL